MALGGLAALEGHGRRVGMMRVAILLVPAAATIWTAWQNFTLPIAPEPLSLSLTGAGALIVNLGCAFLLVR